MSFNVPDSPGFSPRGCSLRIHSRAYLAGLIAALWAGDLGSQPPEAPAPVEAEEAKEASQEKKESSTPPESRGLEERVKQLEEELSAMKLQRGAQKASAQTKEGPGPLENGGKKGGQTGKQASPEEALEQALEESKPSTTPPPAETSPSSALDRALGQPAGPAGPSSQPFSGDIYSRRMGAANLRLIDLSLDILAAAGGSTERNGSIQELQAGGHDPRRRGFTIQNVELALSGAVDPYFTANGNIVFNIDQEGETVVELEEAYFTTLELPFGLQVKGGQFFSEFGRINPRHPHQWDFIDQPVINSRLFGADGMRGQGLRLGWLTPLPFFSELQFTVQNADGETMKSFGSTPAAAEEPFGSIGGRQFTSEREVRSLKDLVYLARWANGSDITDTLNFMLGFSGGYGPNPSGPGGRSLIYGTDLFVKWKPTNAHQGWPFVSWQTEALGRDFLADKFTFDPTGQSFDSQHIEDWGFYTQLLWGFKLRWIAGLRYEFAGGHGNDLSLDPATPAVTVISRRDDPFHDDRHRFSPLISFYPTEFSRIRLQYNYDLAQHLTNHDAHSVWLGIEVGFGAHAAHSY
jgi:hypothetical protein